MERNCLQGCSSLSALPGTNQFKVSVVPQKRAAGRRGPEGLQRCSQVPSLPQLVQVMCGYRVLVGVCGHLDKSGDLASSRITSGGTAGRWDMLAAQSPSRNSALGSPRTEHTSGFHPATNQHWTIHTTHSSVPVWRGSHCPARSSRNKDPWCTGQVDISFSL